MKIFKIQDDEFPSQVLEVYLSVDDRIHLECSDFDHSMNSFIKLSIQDAKDLVSELNSIIKILEQ
jgi:hypothetical protein